MKLSIMIIPKIVLYYKLINNLYSQCESINQKRVCSTLKPIELSMEGSKEPYQLITMQIGKSNKWLIV